MPRPHIRSFDGARTFALSLTSWHYYSEHHSSVMAVTLPPFPEDVPTHPLLVVDYELIKKGDQQEMDKLWEAATKLGFW